MLREVNPLSRRSVTCRYHCIPVCGGGGLGVKFEELRGSITDHNFSLAVIGSNF